MKRHGAVLVFKKGVTPAKAAKALAKLADVLDVPEDTPLLVTGRVRKDGTQVATFGCKPFAFKDLVEEFDDELGGPVWYIP